MNRFLLTLATCLAVTGPALAWTHPDNSEAPDDNGSLPNAWSVHDRESAALAEVAARLHKGDTNFFALSEHLRKVVEDPAFSTLTEPQRHYAYLIYGGTLFNDSQFQAARRAFAQACAMPQASYTDWEFRLKNSVALQDFADAARSATTLARNWPERLAHYDGRVFVTIIAQTKKDPSTAALGDDLNAALIAAHWQATDATR